MMRVSLSPETVALLVATRDALDTKAVRGRKTLPRWLPNGGPITEVKELAAVLHLDEKTAAYVVLDSHAPPESLVEQARRTLKATTRSHRSRIIKHRGLQNRYRH